MYSAGISAMIRIIYIKNYITHDFLYATAYVYLTPELYILSISLITSKLAIWSIVEARLGIIAMWLRAECFEQLNMCQVGGITVW
jgi:hypothetical protein